MVKNGYVYLLECRGLHKVGVTININSRMNSYRTQNPFINIIAQRLTVYYKDIERFVVREFSSKVAYNKEWFRLNAKDVEFIKKVFSGAPIEEEEVSK